MSRVNGGIRELRSVGNGERLAHFVPDVADEAPLVPVLDDDKAGHADGE